MTLWSCIDRRLMPLWSQVILWRKKLTFAMQCRNVFTVDKGCISGCLFSYPWQNVPRNINTHCPEMVLTTTVSIRWCEITLAQYIGSTIWHLGLALCPYPANTRRWPNVGLMLGQRRRRWANVSPTLGQHLVFAGYPGMDNISNSTLRIIRSILPLYK